MIGHFDLSTVLVLGFESVLRHADRRFVMTGVYNYELNTRVSIIKLPLT